MLADCLRISLYAGRHQSELKMSTVLELSVYMAIREGLEHSDEACSSADSTHRAS